MGYKFAGVSDFFKQFSLNNMLPLMKTALLLGLLTVVRAWFPCAPCDHDFQCFGNTGIGYCPKGDPKAMGSSSLGMSRFNDYETPFDKRRGRVDRIPFSSTEDMVFCIVESTMAMNSKDPKRYKRCQVYPQVVLAVTIFCVVVTVMSLLCCFLRLLRRILCCLCCPLGWMWRQSTSNSKIGDGIECGTATRRGDLVMFRA